MNIIRLLLIAPLTNITSFFLALVLHLGAFEARLCFILDSVTLIIPIVAIMELCLNLHSFFLEFGLVLIPLASRFLFFFDLFDLLLGHTFILFGVLRFLPLGWHTQISTME